MRGDAPVSVCLAVRFVVANHRGRKMADEVTLESDLRVVSGEVPTREGLLDEARALGAGFTQVSAPPELLAADAEEMLAGREDLPAFKAAEFPVQEGHFVRIHLLKSELAPRTAGRERDQELRKAFTAKAAKRRDALIQFQRRIKRRARAALLPASLFSLGRVNARRLGAVLWRVEEIALNARSQLARFAQQAFVKQLVDDALALITTIKDERTALGIMGEVSVVETRLQQQLERLLFDTLRYVGAQGQALFDDDPTRDTRYRLDHVYGQRQQPAPEPDDVDVELPPVTPDDDES